MVGAHGHAPGIVHQQIPLQTDRPLQGMHEALVLVGDGHDAAAGFHFDVGVVPFAAQEFVQVVTDRTVGGHAGRFAEQNLAHVHRQIAVSIDEVRRRTFEQSLQPGCGHTSLKRREGILIVRAAAVAVELDVRQVGPAAFERFHGRQRRAPVAGQAEAVAVDVNRVRQTQIHDRLAPVRGQSRGTAAVAASCDRGSLRSHGPAFPRFDARPD